MRWSTSRWAFQCDPWIFRVGEIMTTGFPDWRGAGGPRRVQPDGSSVRVQPAGSGTVMPERTTVPAPRGVGPAAGASAAFGTTTFDIMAITSGAWALKTSRSFPI